jgi:hypothetical protein
LSDLTQAHVQRLNRIGGINHLANLRRKRKERRDMLPIAPPNRLNTPILAIRTPGHITGKVLVTIESGSTIAVVGEVQRSGLIEAVYKCETVAMFSCDLQDRAELINVDVPSLAPATNPYQTTPVN